MGQFSIIYILSYLTSKAHVYKSNCLLLDGSELDGETGGGGARLPADGRQPEVPHRLLSPCPHVPVVQGTGCILTRPQGSHPPSRPSPDNGGCCPGGPRER